MATMYADELIQYFERQIVSHQLSHAYLITGDDLLAKQHVMSQVLAAFYCTKQEADTLHACGQCNTCQRIAANQFADILYVTPQGQGIKVDQIRELKQWLVQSPIEGGAKFAVIEHAQLMNPSAANALLTFLEEPVDNVYLILYSPTSTQLLPTIRSRVQTIHLVAKSQQQIRAEWVAMQVQPHHAQLFETWHEETIARFTIDYDALEVEQWLKRWNQWYRQLLKQDKMAFITLQAQLKSDLTLVGALDAVDYLVRLTHQLLTQKPANYQIQANFLTEVNKQLHPSIRRLLQLHAQLLAAKQKILANVSPQLVLEQLVIQFK